MAPVRPGRASPPGRRKPATHIVRKRPFASARGHNLRRGPACLAGASSGATHLVRPISWAGPGMFTWAKIDQNSQQIGSKLA